MPVFFHITVLYCLPFTNTFMFLLTDGSLDWLSNVVLVIILLIVLIDWVSFLYISILGIFFGFLFHVVVVGPITFSLDFATGYSLVYQFVFATLIGMVFCKKKTT